MQTKPPPPSAPPSCRLSSSHQRSAIEEYCPAKTDARAGESWRISAFGARKDSTSLCVHSLSLCSSFVDAQSAKVSQSRYNNIFIYDFAAPTPLSSLNIYIVFMRVRKSLKKLKYNIIYFYSEKVFIIYTSYIIAKYARRFLRAHCRPSVSYTGEVLFPHLGAHLSARQQQPRESCIYGLGTRMYGQQLLPRI